MKHISIIFLLFTALALSGCGLNYPVTNLNGTVSVDGVPVADGVLSITPTTGESGNGVRVSISNGTYVAKNVPVGTVRVSFTAVKKTGKRVMAMGFEVDEQISLIPPQYDSGIDIEITAGQKIQNFTLETSKTKLNLPGMSSGSQRN